MPILVGIFGSFSGSFSVVADAMFTFGGWDGSSSITTCEQYLFATGTKGTAPASLVGGKFAGAASGNDTSAFVFGGTTSGSGAQNVNTVENYLFATPGTKGTTPSVLASVKYGLSAAGSSTVAYVFGGYNNSLGSYLSIVESYNYASGTTNSAPSALNSGRYNTAAASDMFRAFVFGGTNLSGGTNNVESYSFATGTKNTAPANLATTNYANSASSNATNAFVFGGYNGTAYISTVENYQFGVFGTKGTAGAALSSIRGQANCASNATNAFAIAGYNGTTQTTAAENYIYATPGSKGTAPSAPSSASYGGSAASNRSVTFLNTPDQATTPTDVAFVLGGYNGTIGMSTAEQYIFATGLKGTGPAELAAVKYSMSGASNTTNMFTFGYYSGVGNTGCENYIFATPGTKGTTPTALASTTPYATCAASNNTVAFVFGGYNSSGATCISSCEQYVFATPGSKGTAPTNLATIKEDCRAVGNATTALVVGGWDQTLSTATSVVEQYIFATPGSKGSNAAALSSTRYAPNVSGNSTDVFVYGGLAGSSWANNVSSTDHYIYASLGSRGTSPTALTSSLSFAACVGNATNSFLLGGGTGTTPTYVATTYNYLYASGTTTTPPANLAVASSSMPACSNNRGF